MTKAFDIYSVIQRLLPEGSIHEAGETGPPVAAVAVIIDAKREEGSILLIRRTERPGDPWSGQIAFPGGHNATTDRTFLETAIREAQEEVGIQLRDHKTLGVLPLVYARSRRVVVAPFVFQLKTSVAIRTNYEVAESFWAALSELQQIRISKSEVHVEEGKLSVHSYIYRGRVIWGLTFRIISSLLGKDQ